MRARPHPTLYARVTSIGPRRRPVPGVLPCNVIWTNGERFSGFNPRLPNLMSSPRLQFALSFNRGVVGRTPALASVAKAAEIDGCIRPDRADKRRSATTRHKRPH